MLLIVNQPCKITEGHKLKDIKNYLDKLATFFGVTITSFYGRLSVNQPVWSFLLLVTFIKSIFTHLNEIRPSLVVTDKRQDLKRGCTVSQHKILNQTSQLPDCIQNLKNEVDLSYLLPTITIGYWGSQGCHKRCTFATPITSGWYTSFFCLNLWQPCNLRAKFVILCDSQWTYR